MNRLRDLDSDESDSSSDSEDDLDSQKKIHQSPNSGQPSKKTENGAENMEIDSTGELIW